MGHAPRRATDRRRLSVLPGERFAVAARRRRSSPGRSPTAGRSSAPRRVAAAAAEVRARDARELQRQQAWRDEAARALNALHEDEGTRPVNAAELEAAEEARIARDGPGRGRLDDGVDDEDEDDGAAFGDAARTVDERHAAHAPRLPARRSAASGWSRRSATCSCR